MWGEIKTETHEISVVFFYFTTCEEEMKWGRNKLSKGGSKERQKEVIMDGWINVYMYGWQNTGQSGDLGMAMRACQKGRMKKTDLWNSSSLDRQAQREKNEQNEETAYRWHQSVYYIQLQVCAQTCISTLFHGNSSNIWCCIININTYLMSSAYRTTTTVNSEGA